MFYSAHVHMSHWRSSHYAVPHMRNKNSNNQGGGGGGGGSPNVVRVIFSYHKELL